MAKEMVPWFKEHGQQDDKLTTDEILNGHRFSSKGKRDPRFPDYEKRQNGRLS